MDVFACTSYTFVIPLNHKIYNKESLYLGTLTHSQHQDSMQCLCHGCSKPLGASKDALIQLIHP